MGPLLDGMVIRLHLLASLVRSTAINVHRWLAPTLALSRRNATLNVSSTTSNKHRSQPRSAHRSSNHGDGGGGGGGGNDQGLQKRSSASVDYLRTAKDRLDFEVHGVPRSGSGGLSSLHPNTSSARRTDPPATTTMIGSRSQPQSQRASFIQQIVDVHSIDVHSINHCLSIPFVDAKK